jgi:hypothetical protein
MLRDNAPALTRNAYPGLSFFVAFRSPFMRALRRTRLGGNPVYANASTCTANTKVSTLAAIQTMPLGLPPAKRRKSSRPALDTVRRTRRKTKAPLGNEGLRVSYSRQCLSWHALHVDFSAMPAQNRRAPPRVQTCIGGEVNAEAQLQVGSWLGEGVCCWVIVVWGELVGVGL